MPRALSAGVQLQTYALTIAGRRANNEDAICAHPELGLFVVADGLGGYDGGEVASALAIDTIHELVRRTACDADVTWPYRIDPHRSIAENEVIAATRLAGERINARRTGILENMGSTVALVRIADDRAVIGHVGDSRVYRLRAGTLIQLTADHSLVGQMLAAGIQPDAHFPWRHVITRALGMPCAEPDVTSEPVLAGDVYLVCSDGLYEPLEPPQIATLLDAPAEQACRALVDAAYEAGSRDNISAIVVRIGDG